MPPKGGALWVARLELEQRAPCGCRSAVGAAIAPGGAGRLPVLFVRNIAAVRFSCGKLLLARSRTPRSLGAMVVGGVVALLLRGAIALEGGALGVRGGDCLVRTCRRLRGQGLCPALGARQPKRRYMPGVRWWRLRRCRAMSSAGRRAARGCRYFASALLGCACCDGAPPLGN